MEEKMPEVDVETLFLLLMRSSPRSCVKAVVHYTGSGKKGRKKSFRLSHQGLRKRYHLRHSGCPMEDVMLSGISGM